MKQSATGGKILIVDDEERIRNILGAILGDEGYDVELAKDGFEAVAVASHFKPDLLIVDLSMPGMDGMETIRRVMAERPNAVAVILTAHGTIQSAVDAIKQGVYDYLTKPFDNEQMLLVVKRAFEVYRLTEEVDHLKREIYKKNGVETIIGDSPVMRDLVASIRDIAATEATVLIQGESGTGKELAAKAIHFESKRADRPFVVVDCTAIPANLLESEFFGHEKGAFTDARQRRPGKFEDAHTGTIFLDEISELPLEAQAKLLRVLQEREFGRVGGNTPIKVDVRVIAATNRSLATLVEKGSFREDLYYRLNVLKLNMPALRDHVEDIPLYVRHFLASYRESFGKNVSGISEEAVRLLQGHTWEGNIRELENVVQRAMLSANAGLVEASDIVFPEKAGFEQSTARSEDAGLEAHVKSITEQAERHIILQALRATNWNRTRAAEKLKISRKTLFNKMQQYGIG